MSEITLSFNLPPGAGLLTPNTDSPQSASGGASPRSAHQNDQLKETMGMLLSALLLSAASGGQASSGNDPTGQAAEPGSSGGQNAGQNSSAADMLMKLLEALIPNDAQNNTSSGAGQGAGASPLSGAAGSGDAQQPEDLSRKLLQDTTDNALSNAISPTGDGGGQISDNPLLKALLELIANLMDAQKGAFGQPNNQDKDISAPSSAAAPTSSGGGKGAPSVPADGNVGSGGSPGFSAPAGNGAAPSSPPSSPSSTVAGNGAVSDTGKAAAVAFPTAGSDVTTVDETIKVGPGQVFDGGGKTFVASSKLGDGSQKEGQKPVFELAHGATLKNVVFGDNAADGVHVRGDAEINNVHWTNVGEDALTVKSNNGKPANVHITNSSAQNASDKVFQLNADANLTIDNFKVKDFGTFIRTNGGQQGNWNMNLSNIDAENGKFSFVKSDSDNLKITGNNINLVNVNNHYKVPDSASIGVN
ncbi:MULTISPECIES: pectate lyase [unclassified Brenneria]|uniref:pectate lyase n=1 Tax=unclassified Brenneria TaxID=2634434 RepID=UPI0015572C8F|nr:MULTISPECIES: pectate lyase [unclassified Brenneria]MBJ7220878.1 pectate lyase [Brenneria sp. L3-3C-1]MEE3642117.1 pectate lyase [Brenneria sp. L3_3C_1]MEE3649184.1 pectate lyase [Brenneria sp. HEZEL_4_2_4]NPC99139.1 pectate lyase [Brenneria sp. hezel4-2-4]